MSGAILLDGLLTILRTGSLMKHRIRYTDAPLGRITIIKNFFPPPDQLILQEDGVKVTISLSRRSVHFFKAHASKSKVPHQPMIRRVLDEYAGRYFPKSRRG